jgi:ribosomal protein L7/L12
MVGDFPGPDTSKVTEGLIRVGNFVRNGEKILAIKELRTLFGCGLKEGKDIVEAFRPPTPYP